MRQRITLMFCLLAALLLPNISAVTHDEKPSVVASYSILADVIHNIAGDRVELTTLIPAGADPHTFQPSPRELTPLSEADVIFVNGAGIEEALLGVIAGAAGDTPIVEISACVEIIPIGASGHAHDEHDDEHAHEDDDEHAHDDDDHAHEDDDDHAHEDDDDHAHEDDDEHAHEDDDEHAHEEDDEHAHDDDDEHAHEDDDDHAHEDDDDHAHEDDDEHAHGDMHSHCDEHDGEIASLVEAHHDVHEEVTDLRMWSGEWISVWAFSQAELQGSFDAMLAATPELTADLISEFIEAINYTPFTLMTLDGGSATFDGVTCGYDYAGQSPDDYALFETADDACADTRFLLLDKPVGTHEDGTYHFHMRVGASYDEVTDAQSLSFPSVWQTSMTAAFLNELYTSFARPIGMNIAATYGIDIAMSDEEMAAMSDDHAHDEDEHAHDEDEHAHDEDEHAHDEDEHAHDDDEHAHDEDEHAHDEDEHAHDEDEHAHEEHDHEHDDSAALGRLEDIECGGHGHHEDEHEHAHEEGDCDAHVWMDPHNVMYWALMARDVLSELDPDHADEYAAAAADYISELVALERDFILPLLEGLPLEKRVLITSHDSLGYLAHAFDFEIVSTVIPGGGTQIEPSARDVADLIDLVREEGVAAIFGETTVNRSAVETIAAETGAKLAIIYSGTLTEGEPAGTYLDYMRYNLRTIVEALGG